MSENNVIGDAKCLLCNYEVEVKEQKGSKRAYYVCGVCQTQLFARGAKSDVFLRKITQPRIEPNPVIESQEEKEEEGGILEWL